MRSSPGVVRTDALHPNGTGSVLPQVDTAAARRRGVATDLTEQSLRTGFARLAVAVRVVTTVAAGLSMATAHGLLSAQITMGTIALATWSLGYGVLVLMRVRRTVVAVVDVVSMTLICIGEDLFGPHVIIGHVDWALLLACGALLAAQMIVKPVRGLALCAVVAVGTQIGGIATEVLTMVVLQGLLAGSFIFMLNEAVRRADRAVAAAAAAYVHAAVAAAVRVDEAAHLRRLHDTGMATLTMVATGAVSSTSSRFRARAGADLAALRAGGPEVALVLDTQAPINLDSAMHALESTWVPGLPELRMSFDVHPIRVPRYVAETIVGCAAEALTNVARHAGTDRAWVRTSETDGEVTVAVSDNGRGFDPSRVPYHRRGLRHSIVERMRSVGGSADVITTRGLGTTVTMRWNRDRQNR